MLMTQFSYKVELVDGWTHTTVTRHSDGATKVFKQVGANAEGLTRLMESITDELAEGYWPRERENKKKKAD